MKNQQYDDSSEMNAVKASMKIEKNKKYLIFSLKASEVIA